MQLSILIRNLNEAKSLQQTLLSLKRQQTDFEYEIVVIDNESGDDSVEIATAMGCKVFTLKRSEFTFGHSLNYGIGLCKGEVILILSAHVILLNEFFLQNIHPYFKDPNIAALRFLQSVSQEEVVNGLKTGPRKLSYSDSTNFAADNWKKLMVNHCAAIRRLCWLQVPFDEKILASEDKAWSLVILKKGYSILYNIPGFYVYAKPFGRTTKMKRSIIEEAAKEMITGKTEPIYSVPYTRSLFKKITSGFKRISFDLKIHKQIYKGIKEYKKKYNDHFIKKEI